MSGHFTSSTSSSSGEPHDHQSVGSSEQLFRLVASGAVPVPAGLPVDQLRELIRKVGELRRQRLVQHIARAIALDLHRGEH